MIKWKKTSVDLSTNSTTLNTGQTLFLGIVVTEALSAHPCYIKDGTEIALTIPASSPVGETLSLEGAIFETSLIIDPDDAATGRITVLYKPSA